MSDSWIFRSRSPGVANRPWLPDGFSFLSGLPEAQRRRRYLMPIQAFVDESGGKGQGRNFVMAALAGHSEAWANFTDEWRECLAQSPGIRSFKMREAVSGRGQFHGWPAQERNALLLKLARIINQYARIAIFSVADLEAHAKTWEKTNEKPRNELYFWPFHNIIMAAGFSLWDAGLRERFEVIFDENVIFGPRARAWYPVVRAVCKHKEPDVYTIIPVDPIFRTDDELLPLQAADLVAWCIRRGHDTRDTNEYKWPLQELSSISVSEHSQYYDFDRMSAIWEEAKRLSRDGHVPDEFNEAYRTIFGDTR
jgi:hypothetical protein